MDNLLKKKRNHPRGGANAPPGKGKTKTFLIGKELKKRLTANRGGTGKRTLDGEDRSEIIQGEGKGDSCCVYQ